jgi:hypothetical protein
VMSARAAVVMSRMKENANGRKRFTLSSAPTRAPIVALQRFGRGSFSSDDVAVIGRFFVPSEGGRDMSACDPFETFQAILKARV